MPTSDDIEWLEPWRALSTDEAQVFEAELRREVNHEHPLFGIQTKAIGRRDDNDDVLFRLGDAPAQVAVVHLTWRGSEEGNSRWPRTVIYSGLEKWIEQAMKLDHEEYGTAI